MFEVIEVNEDLRESMGEFLIENWGANFIVSRGNVHLAEKLQGYAVIVKKEMKGLITYHIHNNECEIVSLDSLIENKGIGTMLINRVIHRAREEKCKRVWLITTNDNIKALHYYQKKDFNMIAIHVNAVENARRLKPQIPLLGCDDIPIMHEIEFEMRI